MQMYSPKLEEHVVKLFFDIFKIVGIVCRIWVDWIFHCGSFEACSTVQNPSEPSPLDLHQPDVDDMDGYESL